MYSPYTGDINMKNKIITTFSFLTLFFTGTVSTFATASSTEVTEFLPNFIETTINNSQTNQILERFRGLIPDATINTLSGTNKAVIQINRISLSDTPDLFTKNLKLGDTDSEVLLLQKTLNEEPDTMVSVSGVGSMGKETTYFGEKTKAAIIRLQNKHYGEVLAPNGLSSGTGYFGASTRAMVNTIRKSKSKKTSSVSSESLTSTIPNAPVSGLGDTVKITSLEPTHGKNGTIVTIYGSGMTATANKVIAGGKTIYNVSSSDGKTLVFTMESPVSLDLTGMSLASSTYMSEHFNEIKTNDFPLLKYPVCVVNDTGMSNCAFFTVEI